MLQNLITTVILDVRTPLLHTKILKKGHGRIIVAAAQF